MHMAGNFNSGSFTFCTALALMCSQQLNTSIVLWALSKWTELKSATVLLHAE